MHFTHNKGLYTVSRITGPTHNFLGIRLSESEAEITVMALPIRLNETINITPEDVMSQAISGLEIANRELGKQYYISEIQYVASDTYSPIAYETLTRILLKRISEDGEFVEV